MSRQVLEGEAIDGFGILSCQGQVEAEDFPLVAVEPAYHLRNVRILHAKLGEGHQVGRVRLDLELKMEQGEMWFIIFLQLYQICELRDMMLLMLRF